MVNIAKKKLPTAAISVIVYLSYCAMSWFSMRGTLAYLGQQYGIGGWFANDAWAFFLGGLIPFLLYEVFTSFVFKMTAARAGGDIKSLQYGLNYAVIAANLLLFALKFMYIALPLYAAVIDIIIDPAVTLAFVGLYMWYAFYQKYVDKTRYRLVLSQVMSTFAGVYGLLALVNMIVAVA